MPARPQGDLCTRATAERCPYTPSQKFPSVPLYRRGEAEAPTPVGFPSLRKGRKGVKREAQGDLWGEGGAGFPSSEGWPKAGVGFPSSEGWPKAGVGFGIGQMGQPTPLLRRTPPRRGNKAPKTSHPDSRLLTESAGLLNTPESSTGDHKSGRIMYTKFHT